MCSLIITQFAASSCNYFLTHTHSLWTRTPDVCVGSGGKFDDSMHQTLLSVTRVGSQQAQQLL